jgi:hypothetical protein
MVMGKLLFGMTYYSLLLQVGKRLAVFWQIQFEPGSLAGFTKSFDGTVMAFDNAAANR